MENENINIIALFNAFVIIVKIFENKLYVVSPISFTFIVLVHGSSKMQTLPPMQHLKMVLTLRENQLYHIAFPYPIGELLTT